MIKRKNAFIRCVLKSTYFCTSSYQGSGGRAPSIRENSLGTRLIFVYLVTNFSFELLSAPLAQDSNVFLILLFPMFNNLLQATSLVQLKDLPDQAVILAIYIELQIGMFLHVNALLHREKIMKPTNQASLFKTILVGFLP